MVGPFGIDAVQLGPGGGVGRLALERLEEAARAHVLLGHAHEDGHDLVGLQGLLQVLDDLLGRRLLVLEQLLHQVVVEVGQGLEHLGARRLLALEVVVGEVDAVGGCAFVVGVGLLGDEVDIADEVLAAADGVLVRHDGPGADLAEGVEQVAVADLGAVHLVDEDDVREAGGVEVLEERGHRAHPLDHGLDDDDGEVDSRAGLPWPRRRTRPSPGSRAG